jgi:isochorismate synthase
MMPASDFRKRHSVPSEKAKTKALAAYRLPGNADKVLISGQFCQLDGNSILNSKEAGFIMAPFSEGFPTLWIKAEEIVNFGADSPLISDFPIFGPELTSIQKTLVVSREEYLFQVNEIRNLLKSGIAGKVVLSRQIIIPIEKELPVIDLFNDLCELYQDAFIYLACFPGYGLWLGATPETLLNHQNQTLITMALAGTRRAGEKSEWIKKEIEEHAFVADYIRRKLETAGCPEIVDALPYTFQAGKIEHLRTDFRASCHRNKIAGIVNALHPTPAVCGWPSEKALEIIRMTEKHSRAYYTGYLGPVNQDIVQLFVNLRCLQIAGDKAILYIGGGLTVLSDPQAEWDETVLKSTTMLAAIEKMRNLAG